MGVLLILFSAAAGYCLLKQTLRFERPLVSFAGAFLVGCLLSGTLLYLTDLIFVKLLGDYSNATLVVLIAAGVYVFLSIKRIRIKEEFLADIRTLRSDRAAFWSLGTVVLFSIWLNWHSLSLTANGDVLVANGAWSDLMYHLSYARSVVFGKNVPIQYPYFANEPIRYHFLFDYFAGKIAQLGLDSVQALNLLSTAALVSLLMLVFELARSVFKSALSGILSVVFLIFHGSLSVFPWLSENLHHDLIAKIVSKDGWLARAPFEEWGLFNLNVFVNQRHFAFGLGILVLLVIALIQLTEEATEEHSDTKVDLSLAGLKELLRRPRELSFIVLWAVIIGCMPFWNALFAAVAVSFLLAFALLHFGNRKLLLTLVATAIVASLTVYPQLMLFKAGASALADYPRFHFGYALDQPSPHGFANYYLKVYGAKIFLVVAAWFLLDRKRRLYCLILLIPFFIANLFQLSSVLYDNNKLILASVVFMNCYAAYAIVELLRSRTLVKAILAVVLSGVVTLAGIVDCFAVRNLKQTEIADQSSSLKWWIIEQTNPRSVFLTNTSIPFADNAVSAITLAGRYLYAVSNCVSSSCSVEGRLANARRIYSLESGVEQTKVLMEQERINYVLIDEHVRNNPDLRLNERAFIENFKMVYRDDKVSVFSAE